MKKLHVAAVLTAVALMAAGCNSKTAQQDNTSSNTDANVSANTDTNSNLNTNLGDGNASLTAQAVTAANAKGIFRSNGKLYLLGDNGKISLIDRDIDLSSGIKASANGVIYNSKGIVVNLKDDQQLSTNGSVSALSATDRANLNVVSNVSGSAGTQLNNSGSSANVNGSTNLNTNTNTGTGTGSGSSLDSTVNGTVNR